jgi:hypothetical protein
MGERGGTMQLSCAVLKVNGQLLVSLQTLAGMVEHSFP